MRQVLSRARRREIDQPENDETLSLTKKSEASTSDFLAYKVQAPD